MNRRWAVLLALAIPLAQAGCKTAATARSGPDSVYMAAEYPTLQLETLAYLGLASTVFDPVGVPVTDGLLKSYLSGGQQSFIVMDESACRARARSAGVEETLDKLIRSYKNDRTLDKFMLKEIKDRTGIDGVVFGELFQWREEQVDWQGEGSSFTEVGISISIYDASTGILAWKAERMERQESAHYRHGQGTGSGVYQQGGVDRSDRADRIAPKPPKPEPVAESVVQTLIDALPRRAPAKS